MFYDNWVARDINGIALENAPFESIFSHGPSQERFMQHMPIQVQSCWNGITILGPAPFYTCASGWRRSRRASVRRPSARSSGIQG